jgi:hypothetical protein
VRWNTFGPTIVDNTRRKKKEEEEMSVRCQNDNKEIKKKTVTDCIVP